MVTNRFVKKRLGRFTLWLAEPLADSPLQKALSEGLASLAKTYSLSEVPASKSADVYKFTYSDDSSMPGFYFKQYHYRSVWDFIKHTFRPGRARRTMQAAQMLEANGFLSPAIAAMGYRRKWPFCVENFLLTYEVKNALPMYAFFSQNYERPASDFSFASKRNFIKAVGRFVGRLHSKNISHGDLRLGNILVRSSPNQQPSWKFFLLDNERTVQYLRLPNLLRLKNLVQCNMHRSPAITRTDRLRFFNSYLSENSSLAPARKQWAKKIQRKTSRRLDKLGK